MMSKRLRPYAWLGIVASFFGAAYALMTIAMIASLSGAPNYKGNAARDVLLPEVVFVVSLLIAAASVIVLVRTRRRAL
jgi:hypothetical protein